jgi:hypothetical protein
VGAAGGAGAAGGGTQAGNSVLFARALASRASGLESVGRDSVFLHATARLKVFDPPRFSPELTCVFACQCQLLSQGYCSQGTGEGRGDDFFLVCAWW